MKKLAIAAMLGSLCWFVIGCGAAKDASRPVQLEEAADNGAADTQMADGVEPHDDIAADAAVGSAPPEDANDFGGASEPDDPFGGDADASAPPED